jgi:hypothetical protein
MRVFCACGGEHDLEEGQALAALTACPLGERELPKRARRPRRRRTAIQPSLLPPPPAYGPRADFACGTCGMLELPLKAQMCPLCGGGLERRFTPPMINSAAIAQVTKIAEAEFAKQDRPSPIPEEKRTRPMAMNLNSVPAEAQQGSRVYSAPTIDFMRGKLPQPSYRR